MPPATTPTKTPYKAGQLQSLLQVLQRKQVSGILHLEAKVQGQSRFRIFLIHRGCLMYTGLAFPTAQDLKEILSKKLKSE